MKHVLALICLWEILGIYLKPVPTISRTLQGLRNTGWFGFGFVALLVAAATMWLTLHILIERRAGL